MKHSEQSPMKLSEAIRLGAMIRPQAFRYMFASGGSCAAGAALEAIGAVVRDGAFLVSEAENSKQFRASFVEAERAQDSPCACGSWQIGDEVFDVVTHLNDHHRWTREAIADWVETIEQAQSSALVPQSAENIMEKEVEELAMVNK